MKSRLWSLAAAAVFVLSAAAGAFAADTDDDPCSGTKPFREVAQDEIHTMAELCMMQEGSRRENGGWTNVAIRSMRPKCSTSRSWVSLNPSYDGWASVRRHALADKFLYRPLVLGKMRQPIPAARSALG